MMNTYVLFAVIAITIAVAVPIVPNNCQVYCRNRTLFLRGSQTCSCPKSKSITPRSWSELSVYPPDSSILYEPIDNIDGHKPFTTNAKPFLIYNPISKPHLIYEDDKKTKPVDASIQPKPVHAKDKIINISSNEEMFADLGIKSPREATVKNHVEHLIKTTKENLIKCIDLHIITLSRKKKNNDLSKQSIEPLTSIIYDNLSDTELMSVLQSKCNHTHDALQQSLREIKESQPKRNKQSDGFHDGTTLELFTSTYRTGYDVDINNRTDLEGSGTSLNQNHISRTGTDYNKLSTALLDRNVDGILSSRNMGYYDTNEESTVLRKNRTNTNIEEINRDVETTTDHIFSKSTLSYISRRNEDDNADYMDIGEDSNQTSEEVPKHQDLFDTTTNNFRNNIEEDLSTNDFVNMVTPPTAGAEELAEQSIESSLLMSTNDFTTETVTAIPTEQFTIDDKTSTNLEDIEINFNKLKNADLSDESQLSSEVSRPLMDTQLDDSPLSRVTDVEKVSTGRTLKESEVEIPKLLTKEHTNGSVTSVVDGFEHIPNKDYAEPTDSDQFLEMSANMQRTYLPVVSGNIFFVFNDQQVPARFVQEADGVVHVGIEGDTLCKKLKISDNTLILSTLCKLSEK